MQIPTTQPDGQGNCIHANGAWRFGVEERQTDESSSLLGQLGGLFAHGPTAPSQDCSFVCGPFEWTSTHPVPQSSVGDHISLCGCRFRGTDFGRFGTWCSTRAREPEKIEPGAVRRRWQHNASSEVEKHARSQLFCRVSNQVSALLRSQGSSGAGAALTALPTGRETTTPPHFFRVILLRKLRQPLPSLAVSADVAFSSTPIAIIAQHVPVPGCSVAEVFR